MSLENSVAALTASLQSATDDQQRLVILRDLVVQHEALQRSLAGLPQHHALTLNDLFFPRSAALFDQFKAAAFAEAQRAPSNGNAVANKILAMICAGDDLAAIEAELAKLRPRVGGHVFTSCSFAPEVYRQCEAMTDADINAAMPVMDWAVDPSDGDGPILLLGCDYSYFALLGAPLLQSLAAQGGGAAHLHLMDCAGDNLAGVIDFCSSLQNLAVGITHELTGLAKTKEARNYYHAARFVRLYQLIKHYQRPLWLMDVDALFNRPPAEIFNRFSSADLAFRIRPGRLEPWNQFNACMVGAQVTPASLTYLHMIAAYVARGHAQKTLRWGVDQFAMYGVYDFLARRGDAPTLAFLDEIALDYVYREDGVVWCNSGADKFAQIKRPPGAPVPDSEQRHAKYIALFDRYRAG